MSALLLLFLAFRPFFSFSASPGLSEAGACFGCSPSAVGATGPRTTFSHSKRVGLDPKSASAPQTSQSTSQLACGALHHAVSGGLVHELPPVFPCRHPPSAQPTPMGVSPQSPNPRFGPAQCMSPVMPGAGQVATYRPLKLAGRLRAQDTRPRWCCLVLSARVADIIRPLGWLGASCARPAPPPPFPVTNDGSWNPAAIVSIPSNSPSPVT